MKSFQPILNSKLCKNKKGTNSTCKCYIFNVFLKILGNASEFQRISKLLAETLDFDMDINVSVFETNIRGE